MNKLTRKSAVCALALAFLSPLLGSTLYFSFTQGTGNQSDDEVGYAPIDNPGYLGSANNVTSPALSIYMTFFNPWGDALFTCQVNTNVSPGNYWVGDFKDIGGSGADVYAYIN